MTVVAIDPIDQIDPTAVDALLDRAFGTDRHLRTAYQLRRGTRAIPALSFAARDSNGALVGTVQCWPVALTTDDGDMLPLVMVGPVAVEPAVQQGGIGRGLMSHMLAAADAVSVAGSKTLMLIGDPEYYGRFFGFDADVTSGWRLPGPFEPRRLLARGATPRFGRSGVIGPRP